MTRYRLRDRVGLAIGAAARAVGLGRPVALAAAAVLRRTDPTHPILAAHDAAERRRRNR